MPVMASSVRPTFLVERYAADLTVDRSRLAGRRAEEAAPRIAQGARTRYLGSILLPSDEMALCLFEGSSEEVVRRAVGLDTLGFERVTQAVRVDPPPPDASLEEVAAGARMDLPITRSRLTRDRGDQR